MRTTAGRERERGSGLTFLHVELTLLLARVVGGDGEQSLDVP